jgi:hypothetical protein
MITPFHRIFIAAAVEFRRTIAHAVLCPVRRIFFINNDTALTSLLYVSQLAAHAGAIIGILLG